MSICSVKLHQKKKEKSECHENMRVVSPVISHGLVRLIFDSQHLRENRFLKIWLVKAPLHEHRETSYSRLWAPGSRQYELREHT